MSHLSNNTREAVDALVDHIAAQAKTIDELEQFVWYATDILLTADQIFRKYGPPNAPTAEVRGLLDTVRDYLLTCPTIDADLHNLPLPARPKAPRGGAAEGEAAAPSPGLAYPVRKPGPVLADTVDHFPNLQVTDDIDGRDAA